MYAIIEVYATHENDGSYLDIYMDRDEAESTGFAVADGWIVINEESGRVADDTHDIYFDYSEAVNDLIEAEAKHDADL